MDTGLADGEGSVTWGASAGRSSRRSYTGQFTAGRTAERVRFTWKEKRPGQIGVGNHAYNGTVEVGSCSALFAIFVFVVVVISFILCRLRRDHGQDKRSSSTTCLRCEACFKCAVVRQCHLLNNCLQGGSYEGSVADGKYHGWGRLINTLGTVTEGNWIHGQLE